jgi:hypothetical protein
MSCERKRVARWLVAGLASAGLAAGAVWAEERAVDLATDEDAVRIDSRFDWSAFGYGMTACDLNHDGIRDLLVSDGDTSGGGTRPASGEIYVFYGRRRAWEGPLRVPDAADVVIYGEEHHDGLNTMACGDVDGDGYTDLLACAPGGDGPNNDRTASGQAHIIIGGPSWPPVIDLAEDPGTVIYGEGIGLLLDDGALAYPETADIDGDGVEDVILSDWQALDIGGSLRRTGRAYVLFGRPTWPEEIDLRHGEADVTVYGGDETDSARSLGGDLDGDGTDELILFATGGDGPDNSRDGAGDTYVFLGRPSWPAEIDLATDQGDMFIYGPDLYDSAWPRRLGDLDADGLREIVFGLELAEGPTNEDDSKGEVRTFEPGRTPWPSLVDLRERSDAIVYGRDRRDYFGGRPQVGDVDGDDTEDLVAEATEGDGPSEGRRDAGEVYTLTGGVGFPEVIDLATDEAEVVIYGAKEYDFLTALALPDLNGDGLREIAAYISSAGYELGSVYVVSPYDVDGDGITQLPDNCPLVANPGQADSDGDQRGDACEEDWDGDGLADGDDCAPNDPEGGTPGPVEALRFEDDSKETLIWQAAVFADRYDVSRGDLDDLDGSDYGACQNDRDPDRTDTRFTDPDVPSPAAGYHYLVRGRDAACSLAGSWGTGSGGAERENANPAACP